MEIYIFEVVLSSRNNNIKSFAVCLDNDIAGNEAYQKIVKIYRERVRYFRVEPIEKDFYDDLISLAHLKSKHNRIQQEL